MAGKMHIFLAIWSLTVSADNFFTTEREWLAKNPGKKKNEYDKLLQAFQQRLADERAEDYEDEQFADADLNKDGTHSKDEVLTDLMRQNGYDLDKQGMYVSVGARDLFESIDRSPKDGKVDLKEYLAHFKGHTEKDFKKSDADGDGFHTFEEQMALTAEHDAGAVKSNQEVVNYYFQYGDKNKDGKLDKKERRHAAKHHGVHIEFNEIDFNQDGKHTRDELIQADMRKNQYVMHSNGAFFEEEMYGRIEDDFGRLDKNRDGKVSQEEFLKGNPKSNEAAFKAVDFNKDGFHTMDEILSKQSGPPKSAMKMAEDFADDNIKALDKNGDGVVTWDEYRRETIPDDEL